MPRTVILAAHSASLFGYAYLLGLSHAQLLHLLPDLDMFNPGVSQAPTEIRMSRCACLLIGL